MIRTDYEQKDSYIDLRTLFEKSGFCDETHQWRRLQLLRMTQFVNRYNVRDGRTVDSFVKQSVCEELQPLLENMVCLRTWKNERFYLSHVEMDSDEVLDKLKALGLGLDVRILPDGFHYKKCVALFFGKDACEYINKNLMDIQSDV